MKNNLRRITKVVIALLFIVLVVLCAYLSTPGETLPDMSNEVELTEMIETSETAESTEFTVAFTLQSNVAMPKEIGPGITTEEATTVVKTTETETEPSKPEIVLKDLGTFKCTAYCNCAKCCGKNFKGITRSGTHTKEGRTIAVDPRVIPLGTTVYIDGVPYIAEDTGSAVKGKIVDIFFESYNTAVNYGVQYHNVKIQVK